MYVLDWCGKDQSTVVPSLGRGYIRKPGARGETEIERVSQ